MSRHADHAERLERLLARTDDPRALDASELASCAECRRVAEAHARLVTDLEALAVDERASLAAAERLDLAPGRAEAALRARVLGPWATARPARRRRALALAAAALALLTVFLRTGGGGEDADPMLGPRAGLLHPRGTVERFEPFRWDVPLPEGGWFVVRVEGEGLSLESGRLALQEWSPEGSFEWPARIRWTLEVYRASGSADPVASYVEWAER